MSEKTSPSCSFCGVVYSVDTPLIVGQEGHICEACVQLASKVVGSWGRKRTATLPLGKPLTPMEVKARLDDYIIGQHQAKETLSVAIYNHYKRLLGEVNTPSMGLDSEAVTVDKSNILLLGPSGTGKTLLASTLAKIIDVPFAVADATTLTQAGYVGDDVETIISRLLDAADGNVELAEWGVVYIDEIDKLAFRSESAHATRDVSGEGVQQALLKLVEGSQVKLSGKGSGRDKGEEKIVDTKNILFIAGGAFSGLEAMIEKRLKPARVGIGFHATFESREGESSTQAIFTQVHADDLKKFGLIPEFIGRFPIIAGLQQLDIEALVQILTQPKNALVRQYQQLFKYDNVELEFTQEALEQIAANALATGTGARGLRSILESLLTRAMFEVPSNKSVTRCVVDEAVVTGDRTVLMIGGSTETVPAASTEAALNYAQNGA